MEVVDTGDLLCLKPILYCVSLPPDSVVAAPFAKRSVLYRSPSKFARTGSRVSPQRVCARTSMLRMRASWLGEWESGV